MTAVKFRVHPFWQSYKQTSRGCGVFKLPPPHLLPTYFILSLSLSLSVCISRSLDLSLSSSKMIQFQLGSSATQKRRSIGQLVPLLTPKALTAHFFLKLRLKNVLFCWKWLTKKHCEVINVSSALLHIFSSVQRKLTSEDRISFSSSKYMIN